MADLCGGFVWRSFCIADFSGGILYGRCMVDGFSSAI